MRRWRRAEVLTLAGALAGLSLASDVHAQDELRLAVAHINAADYPAWPDSGVVSAWMALKYLGNGSDAHLSASEPPPQAIWDFARSVQPARALNYFTLAKVMNRFESAPAYHYRALRLPTFQDAVGAIGYWMNRSVPGALPYPVHAPALIPFGGVDARWVVVTGIVSDLDPYLNPGAPIRGLWVDDPLIYSDPLFPAETNLFYSADEDVALGLSAFFRPIYGAHVVVVEPPGDEVRPRPAASEPRWRLERPTRRELESPTMRRRALHAARAGIDDHGLNRGPLGVVLAGATPGEARVVRDVESGRFHYLVEFHESSGAREESAGERLGRAPRVVAEVLLDGASGKLAAFHRVAPRDSDEGGRLDRHLARVGMRRADVTVELELAPSRALHPFAVVHRVAHRGGELRLHLRSGRLAEVPPAPPAAPGAP